MAKKNAAGHWLNGLNEAVPVKYVPKIDKVRDRMVCKLFKGAEDVHDRMIKLRSLVDKEVDIFLNLAASEHNMTLNKGGNYCFTGFSADKRVEIKVGKFIDFDEKLKFAKQKIDNCIKRWSKGADEKLCIVVNEAFQGDAKGRVDTKRILGLRKLEINDREWQEAMELISKAITVAATKVYVRFQQRDKRGEWQTVRLDMAAI